MRQPNDFPEDTEAQNPHLMHGDPSLLRAPFDEPRIGDFRGGGTAFVAYDHGLLGRRKEGLYKYWLRCFQRLYTIMT